MTMKGRHGQNELPSRRDKPPHAGMSYTVKPTVLRYRGVTVPYDLPAWRSDGDEDALIEGVEALRMDEVSIPLRAYVDDIASPVSIRMFRESLGLSLENARDVFGVEPETFSAYESGERDVPPELLNLLRLVANDPGRLRELQLTPEQVKSVGKGSPLPVRGNRQLSLMPRQGLGAGQYLALVADGLQTQVLLHPSDGGPRSYAVTTHRIGIRRGARTLYREGPLDREPVEQIVESAIRDYGLDPEQASWKEILAAAQTAQD